MLNGNIHTIKITYSYLPIMLQKYYRHREPQFLSDSMKSISERFDKPRQSFSVDDLFGSNLTTSGSLVRGFSFGTNRDLTLNSGFRMQMSGKLANDVDVIASLTDENSPLQPEGTTQTLQEIDKVLVEIRGEKMSATLGDININVSQNEFGIINRKLSGAKGTVDYNIGSIKGDVTLAGANTRGKYIANEFQGIDGVQGPYRLTGERNNRAVIVIAGSERVFINGDKMLRGENADYTIDYATAELTFMPKRLITSGSRIVVDFEYSDRQFNRSLYGGKSGLALFDDKVKMNFLFFQENDNENTPVDFSFSENDKSILRAAGNDPRKAFRSGIEEVGPGKGLYYAIDTLVKYINGSDTLLRIYRYNPVDTIRSVYNIVFSYTGDGNGSYKKLAVGKYEFAGFGLGNYAPIRYLPVPESRSLMDIDLNLKPFQNFELNGEFGASKYSANKFSPSAEKNSQAFTLKAYYSPEMISIAGLNLGTVNLSFKNRYTGKDFSPMDRVNEIEYNRNWNINDSSKQDENVLEGTISYLPNQAVEIGSQVGQVTRGTNYTTDRYTVNAELHGDNYPNLQYKLENLKTKNNILDLNSKWNRQQLKGKYRIGMIEPRIRFSYEDLRNHRNEIDTLVPGSYRWSDIGGGLDLNISEKIDIGADVGIQHDDSLYLGNLTRVADRLVQKYKAGWKPSDIFSMNAEVAAQQRKFSKIFLDRGNNDNSNVLFRWRLNTSPFERSVDAELFYEATRGRAAKLERIFQRVPKGTGSYIYLGDLNHNFVIDQEDFQLSRFDGEYVAVTIQGDQLLPVVEVKASGRFRFEPEKIFRGSDWWEKTLSAISTETYLRVEEKSTTNRTADIYYLKTSRFLNDLTTMAGSNLFVQDVNIFKNERSLTFSYRFTQSKGLTQFALSGERIFKKEHTERIRLQLIDEVGNQTEITQKIDTRTAVMGGLRSYSIYANSFKSDWSYRPWQEFEMGFKFGFGKAVNFDTTSADMNDQSVRFQYGFSLEGQLSVEFTREEVILNHALIEPMYEITEGRARGQSWLWRCMVDYQLAKYLRLELNYLGRSEGKGSPVHNAKAELRAFF
jgi:hypothetical protein